MNYGVTPYGVLAVTFVFVCIALSVDCIVSFWGSPCSWKAEYWLCGAHVGWTKGSTEIKSKQNIKMFNENFNQNCFVPFIAAWKAVRNCKEMRSA